MTAQHPKLFDDERGHGVITDERKRTIATANNPADARRLVACWNACEGIDTEDLEAGSTSIIEKLHDQAAKAVLDQRHELLAALEEIVKNDPYRQSSAGIIARAAIAKATNKEQA